MDRRLDLDALLPDPEAGFTWNGVFYEYANRYAWGLLARKRFEAVYQRTVALEQAAAPTEADAVEYEARLRELVRLMVPTLPDEQVALLTPEQQGLLLTDFLAKFPGQVAGLALLRKAQALAERTAAANQSGAPSSLDSPPATAASLPRSG